MKNALDSDLSPQRNNKERSIWDRRVFSVRKHSITIIVVISLCSNSDPFNNTHL